MNFEYLNLNTVDPYFNLACEQFVFDELPRDRSYLMLWQNDRTVVVGKYQNTYAQINPDFVRENGIRVARRLSGGGAVYHDLGNINYTIISDAHSTENLDMKIFCLPVVRMLEKLGVGAEISGRNDITIGGKKISGNSQYVKENRVMHHGTILFDSDISVVGNVLRVDESKIKSKGIQSVRSRVTNVRPWLKDPGITVNRFKKLLLEEVTEGSDAAEIILSEENLKVINSLRKNYASWEWIYGRSPEFNSCKSRRFEGCGSIEVFLKADKGVISNITFCGDYFSFADPVLLAERLAGCSLTEASIKERLQNINPADFFSGVNSKEFTDFLVSFTC